MHPDARRRGALADGHHALARQLPRPRAARGVPAAGGRTLSGLELLAEADGLPALDLPEQLAQLYGGSLGFPDSCVYANFVSTVDGVVAIPDIPRASRLISGDSESDRFVMGLLRACADAVVVGSGTLAGSPKGRWTPDGAYPDAAEAFAELRRRLGKPPLAELVVFTATGSVDPAHPALDDRGLVVTTDQGAERLGDEVELVSLGAERHLDPRAAFALLRARGHRLILAEAGPHLFGSLLAADLVDELFLTLSPLIAGRRSLDGRLPLVEEHQLLPDVSLAGRLLSIRRDSDHLFLRYELVHA